MDYTRAWLLANSASLPQAATSPLEDLETHALGGVANYIAPLAPQRQSWCQPCGYYAFYPSHFSECPALYYDVTAGWTSWLWHPGVLDHDSTLYHGDHNAATLARHSTAWSSPPDDRLIADIFAAPHEDASFVEQQLKLAQAVSVPLQSSPTSPVPPPPLPLPAQGASSQQEPSQRAPSQCSDLALPKTPENKIIAAPKAAPVVKIRTEFLNLKAQQMNARQREHRLACECQRRSKHKGLKGQDKGGIDRKTKHKFRFLNYFIDDGPELLTGLEPLLDHN